MQKFNIKSLLVALAIVLLAPSATAQNYKATPDIIYGQRCYLEQDGKYYQHGDKNGVTPISWPTNSNVQVVYYLHVPEGNTKLNVYITPKRTCALRLKVTDPETGSIIYETEEGASGTKQVALEMMTGFPFPQDQWYRFEFSSTTGSSSIASLDKLEFYRESNKEIMAPAIFMAPSVHLWTSSPVDPSAPGNESYDWAYQEVMYPSKYERGARYVESIGVLKGYMGIQYTEKGNRNVIFSMWDNGSTDADPNLPDYLRSGLMDKDPRVTAERFKGEGTGQKTIFENGQYYRPDTWVQFLFNARPEVVDVTLTGSKGQDSVIQYQNTITTAWYKMEDDTDWTYISSIRASGAANYFYNFYSFLENFGDNGCEYTRAYYRKAYMRSIASGKWYNVNHFTYGHTQGTSARHSRSDYGHGVTDVYPNAFYLEHGAFTTVVNDSSQYAGIPLDQSCVDTIDIDSKIERVNLAIKRNNADQANTRLEASGEVYDLTKWQVIGFSDQEEEADENNGRAYMAVDGDSKTYWQNKWRNGGVTYPHWIALKAPKPVTINQVNLTSAKTSYLYWPKTLVVHTSDDGINWTPATDTVTIDKIAKSKTVLPSHITSQYFKIEFVAPYGAMLYINELGLSTDVSTTKIMDYASSLLKNADRFDSYTTKDLQLLSDTYADGNGDPDKVKDAIKELATNCTLLKYGTIKYAYHLSSIRNYQICNTAGLGKLILDGGNLTIGEAETASALDQYKGKVDVTQPQNNWMFIRAERENYYYLYSPTEKKYLDLSSPTLFSDIPVQVKISYRTSPTRAFRIESGNKYLSVDPTSPNNPVKATTVSNDNCYFSIYDNYYLTPKQSEALPIIEECEDYAKLTTYKSLADNMLRIKEGVVGYPLGDSRVELERIYNRGNVTTEQRHALYDAVDNCERIPYDPAKYCYRFKSNNLTSNPYLAATASPAITTSNSDSDDPAQIWTLRAKGEGLSISSQSTVLGRLPNYSYENIPITDAQHPRDFGTYYITEEMPGTFMVSTNQHGGIALGSGTIGQSAYYYTSYAGFTLEIADKINVQLNEAGLRGVNYNFDVIVPEELQVFVVDHIEDGTACFLRVYDRLPAGTPAVIKGNPDENITLQIEAPASQAIEDNMLHGTYFKQSDINGNLYVLDSNNGGCFSKASSTTVADNSVYLLLDAGETAPLALSFSDDPAGVESASAVTPQTPSATYDLQGRKVDANYKGIVIQGNSKVLK